MSTACLPGVGSAGRAPDREAGTLLNVLVGVLSLGTHRTRISRPARVLAALGIQEEAAALASEVARRDGVDLQLRVGLNSGQVIAGEVALGYAATGETVGLAQRMESAAQPGSVLLSQSTARLVEHAAAILTLPFR